MYNYKLRGIVLNEDLLTSIRNTLTVYYNYFSSLSHFFHKTMIFELKVSPLRYFFWDRYVKLVTLQRGYLIIYQTYFVCSYSHIFERYGCFPENSTLRSQTRLMRMRTNLIHHGITSNSGSPRGYTVRDKKKCPPLCNFFCFDHIFVIPWVWVENLILLES